MGTLDQLRPGDEARIVKVRATGSIGQRLGEMGLFEGAVIRMVRTAPLGDPIEYEIHDYHLSLRKAEASLVDVERSTEP